MYTVICDNCGKDVCEGEDYSAWNDQDYVESIAAECGWKIEDDKHYCDECHSYDDEDNLVINKAKKKS